MTKTEEPNLRSKLTDEGWSEPGSENVNIPATLGQSRTEKSGKRMTRI